MLRRAWPDMLTEYGSRSAGSALIAGPAAAAPAQREPARRCYRRASDNRRLGRTSAKLGVTRCAARARCAPTSSAVVRCHGGSAVRRLWTARHRQSRGPPSSIPPRGGRIGGGRAMAARAGPSGGPPTPLTGSWPPRSYCCTRPQRRNAPGLARFMLWLACNSCGSSRFIVAGSAGDHPRRSGRSGCGRAGGLSRAGATRGRAVLGRPRGEVPVPSQR